MSPEQPAPSRAATSETTRQEVAPVANPADIPVRGVGNVSINVSLGVLAIISVVAALYVARAFFVPLLIGILASYTLSPLVGWLKACRVSRPLGAALVLSVLVGCLAWVTFSLSDDATAMIQKLPEATRKLRQHLIDTRTGPTTLQNMQEAAKHLEGATTDAGTQPEVLIKSVRRPDVRVTTAHVAEPSAWLRDYALVQSALLLEVFTQAPIVLLLTYFLLASGPHFRHKLEGLVGPSPSSKRDVVAILDEVTVQVQRYLLTMLVSNIIVGAGTWLAFRALGLEQAGAWGVVAGVLHSIPYLGPASVAIAAGMAAFLQFGTLIEAFYIFGASLLVATVVGFVFMPWLQSRFAHVNTAVLFIALLFFGWLWGAWGLLLGAPLVAIVKVVCDRVNSLKPIGVLLGR